MGLSIFTRLCHHHHQLQNILTAPERNLIFISSDSLPLTSSQLLAATDILSVVVGLSIRTVHVNGRPPYAASMTDCSCLTQCVRGSSERRPFSIAISRPHRSLLARYREDVRTASTFWLLCVMLLWIFSYRFLCERKFSVLLGIYLGVELVGHMVTLHLTFWGAARLFSEVVVPLHNPTSSVWGSPLFPIS